MYFILQHAVIFRENFVRIEARATVVAVQQPLVECTPIMNRVHCLSRPSPV